MAALQLRPKHRTLQNPSLINLFSTSSTPPPPDPTPAADESPSSTSPHPIQSQSSFFSDIKASLKQQQPQDVKASLKQQRQQGLRNSPSFFSKPSEVAASLEEIRKTLTEFRIRSDVPPPTQPNSASSISSSSLSSSQDISFQDLYKRNVIAKAGKSAANAQSGPGKVGASGGLFSFEAIRESLQQMKPTDRRSADPMASSELKSSLRLKPSSESGPVIGGTDRLPLAVFGKERERKEREGETSAMRTEFLNIHTYKVLGEKLRKLRPDGKKEGEAWFSLGELNERLIKLRELEEKEIESRRMGGMMKDLRDCLFTLRMSDDEKVKQTPSK